MTRSTRPQTRRFPPRRRERTARQFTEPRTVDKHGGRVETRRLRATDLPNDYLDRPGVAQVCQVEPEVRRGGGEPSREVAYAITSVPREQADAATLPGWWRGHRGIENRSHYVRDVTMGEGASRARSGSAPQVLAAFRNTAIGRLRSRGADNIAVALRRNAARVPDLLKSLGILKQ